jgi:hypothetical protein
VKVVDPKVPSLELQNNWRWREIADAQQKSRRGNDPAAAVGKTNS